MKQMLQLTGAVVIVAVAVLLFQVVQRRLSDAAFAFTVNPEVLELLERSLDDQRQLARLDPQSENVYRQHFGELEQTVHRLQILAHNREEMVDRYETILMVVFTVIVLTLVVISVLRQLRLRPRLARVQAALEGLAAGRAGIEVGVGGRDEVGRIAAMIEQTSRVMARDRQRLATLDNLSLWQEAARRHAHEMRTPLTAARLEIERVRDMLAAQPHGMSKALEETTAGALEELDRLGGFAHRFTSFARLPRPQLQESDLGEVVGTFVASFANAWPNLVLELEAAGVHTVLLDQDMVRQVLANLCDNASRAMADRRGVVSLAVSGDLTGAFIDVADDGPGVEPSIRERVFEPYTTTRTIGEGMGLGLAISRKIMLDHGGDLELVASSSEGSHFRMIFPKSTEEGSPG